MRDVKGGWIPAVEGVRGARCASDDTKWSLWRSSSAVRRMKGGARQRDRRSSPPAWRRSPGQRSPVSAHVTKMEVRLGAPTVPEWVYVAESDVRVCIHEPSSDESQRGEIAYAAAATVCAVSERFSRLSTPCAKFFATMLHGCKCRRASFYFSVDRSTFPHVDVSAPVRACVPVILEIEYSRCPDCNNLITEECKPEWKVAKRWKK